MSKSTELTPELIADMDAGAFIETCKISNVTTLKIIADVCLSAMAELNTMYAGMHKLSSEMYGGRNVTNEPKEFSDVLQGLTSVGVKLGELQFKKEIAEYFFVAKTPDCFK